MYTYMQQSYDEISKYVITLLNNFSYYIMLINNDINQLLTIEGFNKNPDFQEFIKQFDMGRYYHFRCQGYMECLIVTQCYSIPSISYWINNLVMPASNHFMQALSYVDKLKTVPALSGNEIFKDLITKTDGFKNIAMQIMSAVKLYNIQ